MNGLFWGKHLFQGCVFYSFPCQSLLLSTTVLNDKHLMTTCVDVPVVTDHPSHDNVPVGKSIDLVCRASSLGDVRYSWERKIPGKRWRTVSNDNTTSYTTDTTLAIGQYMYRCRVRNEAGSIVSNKAIVYVYGEYCPNM